MLWPNAGDQLAPLSLKMLGLHSPIAYVAGEQFGAVFNRHREDYDLHSIHFLYAGRKSLDCDTSFLIALFWRKNSKPPKVTNLAVNLCATTRYPLLEHNWINGGIPYHVVDQQAGQSVITLPYTYLQGFSPASSVAEAVKFGGEN